MFERLTIRRHAQNGEAIDLGLLAESLLFYGRVHILFDRSNLHSLLKAIGPDTLIGLLKDGRIKGTFLSDNLGTITNDMNGVLHHNFSAFQIAADKKRKTISPQDWVTKGFEEAVGNVYGIRRKAKQFIDNVSFRNHSRQAANGKSLIDMARDDLDDRDYVQKAVEIILKRAIPNLALPYGWFFYVVQGNGDYISCTNLDFVALNTEYHKIIPPEQNSLTPAWLLSNLLDARADIFFATEFDAEFVTDKLHSELVDLKLSSALKKQQKSEEQIRAFQTMNFGEANAIREVLNLGERSFDDFLKILDKADKFKKWLQDRDVDEKIINEYYKAVTAESWIEKLPIKVLRFVICTVAGIPLGLVGGAALSAGDAFLLDKIAGGWKPNQFVEGPLKRFVTGN